jgi:hypothetical protein
MPEMADTAVAAEKGRWSQDVTPPLHGRSNSGSICTFQCCKGVTRDPVRIRRDLFLCIEDRHIQAPLDKCKIL